MAFELGSHPKSPQDARNESFGPFTRFRWSKKFKHTEELSVAIENDLAR